MLHVGLCCRLERLTGVPLIAIFILLAFTACSPGTGGTSFDPESIAQKNLPKKGELVRAAALGDRVRVADLLIAGADVNENVGEANAALTPLLAAVAMGKQDVAITLIQSGASVQPTFDGYSAVDYARASNLPEVLREIALYPRARGR